MTERGYQGEIIGGELADLVGEHGIEGIEVLNSHGDVVRVVNEAFPGRSRAEGEDRW